MPQTMMQVSAASRMTSNSISFQPMHALFDEDLVDAGTGEAQFNDPDQFLAGLADTASCSSKGICGADNCRKPDLFDRLVDLGQAS